MNTGGCALDLFSVKARTTELTLVHLISVFSRKGYNIKSQTSIYTEAYTIFFLINC